MKKQLLDRRMVDRNLHRGLVSHKEVDASNANLPDDNGNATYITYADIMKEGEDSFGN